jgi:hypothetical protein
VNDFLTKTLKDIDARRRELEPLVEEYRQLEEAAAALAGVDSRSGGSSRGGTRRKPRRSGATRRPAAGSRRGRPRGSGKRAQQALKLVEGQPGITIPELAKTMKIQPNYLYRVMPTLEQEGKVTRKDKGWFPKG